MNAITTGWLVFRVQNGKPEFCGICKSKEAAAADAERLNAHMHGEPWSIVPIPFLGWGQVSPGVFAENGSNVLRMIAKDMI